LLYCCMQEAAMLRAELSECQLQVQQLRQQLAEREAALAAASKVCLVILLRSFPWQQARITGHLVRPCSHRQVLACKSPS
jgi:hypothetical protein